MSAQEGMKTWRRITKTDRDSRVRSLLQNLCVAEALDPGGVIYLISPWTRDVEVIQNHAGEFDWVDGDWPRGSVRLLDWIRTICNGGGSVRILQGGERGGEAFNAAVERLRRDLDQPSSLELRVSSPLSQSGGNHAKAILTPSFSMTGSMNISDPGLEMHVEHLEVRLSTDREYPEVRRQFIDLWEQYGD